MVLQSISCEEDGEREYIFVQLHDLVLHIVIYKTSEDEGRGWHKTLARLLE